MEAVFPKRAGLMRVQRLKQNQPELFRHGTAFVRGNICNHAKFMEELYQSGRIQDFSFIKLTGQSCKIDLFKDALKEFVPGKWYSSGKGQALTRRILN